VFLLLFGYNSRYQAIAQLISIACSCLQATSDSSQTCTKHYQQWLPPLSIRMEYCTTSKIKTLGPACSKVPVRDQWCGMPVQNTWTRPGGYARRVAQILQLYSSANKVASRASKSRMNPISRSVLHYKIASYLELGRDAVDLCLLEGSLHLASY